MLSYSFDKRAIASPCFTWLTMRSLCAWLCFIKNTPKVLCLTLGGSSTRGIDMKLKVSRATREVIAMLHR